MQGISCAINWKVSSSPFQLKLSEREDNLDVNIILDTEEEAILSFQNVCAYSLTATTQESFEKGTYRFSADDLAWGGMVAIKKSADIQQIPSSFKAIKKTEKGIKYVHYVLFTAEEILEIIAEDFQFSYAEDVEQEIENTYPKAYLNYFIALFFNHFSAGNKANYTVFTELYLQITKRGTFQLLQDEVKAIQKNKDQQLILKYIHQLTKEPFGDKQLKELFNFILSHK